VSELEKYNQNHQGRSSDDSFVNWLYSHSTLPEKEVDVDAAWESLNNKLHAENDNKSGGAKVKPLIFKIAASIILLVVAGYFINSQFFSAPEMVTVSSSVDREQVKLPDGSRVVLNAESSVSFPEEFQDTRNVKLDGEAYFDIVKNETPFIVNTREVAIKVLGTAFNVRSEKEKVSVYVDHGLVSLEKNGKGLKVSKGQMAEFDKSQNRISFVQSPSQNVMSWRTGEFTFDDIPLREATQQLSDYYGVEFKLSNRVKNCKITAHFSKASLSEVIDVLETILDINISQKNKIVAIKGKGCE